MLHERYDERVSDPRVKSTRRKYLQSLERYELITSSGQGRGRMYGFHEP